MSKMCLEPDVLYFYITVTLRVIPQLGCHLCPNDIPFANMYLKVKETSFNFKKNKNNKKPASIALSK